MSYSKTTPVSGEVDQKPWERFLDPKKDSLKIKKGDQVVFCLLTLTKGFSYKELEKEIEKIPSINKIKIISTQTAPSKKIKTGVVDVRMKGK